MTSEQFQNLPASSPGDIIHRLPPMILGEHIYSANELSEIVDWGLDSNAIPDLWKKTKGNGVKVAIIDTGQPDHPDLPEPYAVENFSRSRSPYDKQGHSTHVAGTLAAKLNGVGVVGVAPECLLGFYKALGDDGSGGSSAIVRSIYAALRDDSDILSMSLGSSMMDQQIAQACKDAVDAGKFVVCAAGNDGRRGNQNTIGYPAKLDFTVAIAAYNREGKISDFSSRGPQIDAAFPGEDILSTWPGGGFRRISGTSMATPFASGLVALRLAFQRANSSAKQIRNNADLKAELRDTAQDRGPAGHDHDWGWGIPDPDGFVRGGLKDQPAVPEPKPGDVLELGPLRIQWPYTKPDGETGAFISIK